MAASTKRRKTAAKKVIERTGKIRKRTTTARKVGRPRTSAHGAGTANRRRTSARTTTTTRRATASRGTVGRKRTTATTAKRKMPASNTKTRILSMIPTSSGIQRSNIKWRGAAQNVISRVLNGLKKNGTLVEQNGVWAYNRPSLRVA